MTASCSTRQAPSESLPLASGVGIVAEGCGVAAQLASGVVIGSPDQVVTVAHVIAGATSISIIDQSGHIYSATVRAFDKNRDLAVLAVPGLEAPALSLAQSKTGPGSTLTWSRPDGVTITAVDVTKRLLVTIEDIYVEGTVERRGLEVHGDIGVGDSGGAVLSSTGEVLGIIYAHSRTRDDVGFATDASELHTVLQTMPATPPTTGRCR